MLTQVVGKDIVTGEIDFINSEVDRIIKVGCASFPCSRTAHPMIHTTQPRNLTSAPLLRPEALLMMAQMDVKKLVGQEK